MKKELEEKIIKLRKKYLTYNEISKELNCSNSTVSFYCNKNNIGEDFLKLKNFNITKDDMDLVLELRKNNCTYEEIRKKSKLSKDKISMICRANKISGSFNLTKPSDDVIEEMLLCYNEYKSTRKVGKIFGYSKTTVAKYLNIQKKEKLDEETIKKNNVKSVINWRKDKKQKLVEYKGGCCEKCGYDKCIDALEFHHLDPNQKDFTISAKSYSYERLKKEVDKCILVCRNCHAEIHYNIKNGSIA